MNLKTAVFMILGFAILGVLIAVGAGAILGLGAFAAPTVEDALVADLLNVCRSKFTIYKMSNSELSRKSFCCASSDLNNNGIIGNLEYCAKLCPSCTNEGLSARMICSEPIDYYTTYDSC